MNEQLEIARARVAYWKRFEATRALWYRREARRVAREFARQGAVLESVLVGASDANHAVARVEQRIQTLGPDWGPVLQRVYLVVGLDFARRTREGIKGLAAPEHKGLTDPWRAAIENWFQGEAGKKIAQITETTRNEVTQELLYGIRAGEGIPELARRLRRMTEGFTNERAVTIARTEVIAASNLGSQVGARSTGLVLDKLWIATPDKRTRPAHSTAEGQRRPLDEPYEVGGERLNFPGDGSLGASARNLVRCRCAEGYEERKA